MDSTTCGSFRVGGHLGDGATADVRLAKRVADGVPYALKRFKTHALVTGPGGKETAEALLARANAEYSILAELNHENILGVAGPPDGCFTDETGCVCIALEYAPGASAKERMRGAGPASAVSLAVSGVAPLPLDLVAWVAHDVTAALYYLHGPLGADGNGPGPLGTGPLVHRDVKPGNIVRSPEYKEPTYIRPTGTLTHRPLP
jgi:serine/threonine protein kinase